MIVWIHAQPDSTTVQQIFPSEFSDRFCIFITEAEFLTIAEKLKPHVERRMKIEPFPWLRDYYVDMNKLYTELILEKIENELLGEKCLILQGYQDMFNSNGRDKILI